MYTIDSMSFLFPIVGNYNKINITNEPVLITNIPRKMYLLRNFSQDANIYLGFDENVSPDNGFPILPGETIYLNTAADVYATAEYVSSQGNDVDTKIDLRFMILS